MATGYFVIYLTPDLGGLLIPDAWDAQFDTGDTIEVDRDRFEWSETDPDPDTWPVNAGERVAETRQINTQWRVRIRGPQTVARYAGGVAPLYTLADPRLPSGWNHAARFWGVFTTATNHATLHNHIYTTLGYGPVAGAWAAVDPNDHTQFLTDAVRTFLGLTNAEFLQRVQIVVTQLTALNYSPDELQAILDTPAGKTEGDVMVALAHDLGFTLAQLRNAAISTD